MKTTLFLDTYAIFELIRGHNNYAPYKTGYSFVTTRFNLMELYYNLLLDGATKEKAKEYFDRFIQFVVPVDDDTLLESLNKRSEHRKKKMSYFDWIGYTTALRLGVRFLTGDEDFRGFEQVEFVKGD